MKKQTFFLSLLAAGAALVLTNCTNLLGNGNGNDGNASSSTPSSSTPSTGGNTNSAPAVNLTVTNSNGEQISSFWSDQFFYAYASASDADGDSLSYQWYVNNVLDSSLSTKKIYVNWLTSTQVSRNLKVVVSDGKTTASANVTVTINPGASLQINNDSIYTILKVYWGLQSTIPSDYSTSTFAYTSKIGGTIAPNGGGWRLWGITPGIYWMRYDKSPVDGISRRGTVQNVVFNNGIRHTWTIKNDEHSLENVRGAEVVPDGSQDSLFSTLTESTEGDEWGNLTDDSVPARGNAAGR